MPLASSPRVSPRVPSWRLFETLLVALMRALVLPSGSTRLTFSMRALHARSKSSSSYPEQHTGLLPGCRSQVKHSCNASFSSGASPGKYPARLFNMKPNVEASWSGWRLRKFTSPVLCAYRTCPSTTCAGEKPFNGLQRDSRETASLLTSLSNGTYRGF